MSRLHPERLERRHRLRASQDHDLVKADGRAVRGALCLVLVLERPGEPTRIGFIASRRGVGGSVERNRARRRIREIVRRRWPRMPHTGWWLTFVAQRGALTASHADLATDVERLLERVGVLEPVADGD